MVALTNFSGTSLFFSHHPGPLTNAVLMSLTPTPSPRQESRVTFSTDAGAPVKETDKIGTAGVSSNTIADAPLSNKDKLKKAVKDYGATVVVFHVGMSLISLGACYVAVSRSVMPKMMENLSVECNCQRDNKVRDKGEITLCTFRLTTSQGSLSYFLSLLRIATFALTSSKSNFEYAISFFISVD